MHAYRPSASHPLVPLGVGMLVTAIVAVAAWQSPLPWTYAMDTGNGFLGQTIPAWRAWASGRIPEWSDLLWGGSAVLGDCTNGALYPPHALAYLTTRGAPLRFFDAALALHAGLLAAGSAYLARQLGCARGVQAFAGVLSVLCPAAHYSAIVYFPVFAAQAWWPWVFAAAERLARPATPALGGAMLLGWIALGAQVLAGMPEHAAYCAVPAAAWLLTRDAGLAFPRRAWRLGLLVGGALALAAPQLLATLAYLPATTREASVPGEPSQVAAIAVDRPWQLVIAGTGVLNGIPSFFGLGAPVLALVAAAAGRGRAIFLIGIAIVAFMLATGPATPLYGWLHHVPPFDRFRTPLKLQVMAELALALGATLGADVLRRTSARWARIGVATVAAATVAERAVYVAQEVPIFERLARESIVAPDVVQALGSTMPVRSRRAGQPPPLVLDGTGRYGGHSARSLGALVGLSSLRAYPTPLLPRVHVAVLNVRPYTPPLATLLGVRYALVAAAACDRDARVFAWPVVERTAGFCVLQNPVPVERHEFVRDAVAVADEAAMIARVLADPGGPVPVVAPADGVATSAGGLVMVRSYAPGSARLRVSTARAGLLMVRDSWLPGWRATLDGAPVALHPAAGIYFAVAVPAGVHEVALEYRAPGFRPGVAVLLGWAVGGAAWAAATRRRRPARATDTIRRAEGRTVL